MTDTATGGSATGDGGGELLRSVEVEYWVIDEDGRLTDPGELVDASAGVEREFVVPLLEVKTTPCESTGELREELFERLGRVVERADALGKRLVPLATPIYDGEIPDLGSERTRIQHRVVGDRFEYVRHCAGTHVHVEQLPGREIDQLNALTALDPALALVNSSPHFGHEPLATGARSMLYRWMAYDQLPRQGELWSYTDDTEEWARRLERRYESFVTEAVVAGCERETVESCFTPESAVWTPVKLRAEFGTVEWRSPDAALPSQIVRLADDVVGIVERLGDADLHVGGDPYGVGDEAVVLPTFDTVRDRVEDSVRNGLASNAVRSYLDRMGFDVDAYEPLSAELREWGSLTETDARRMRLDCADRLERDVYRRRPLIGD